MKPFSKAKTTSSVTVRRGWITLPTWLPAAPDKNPMFLEKRVYQGSNGKVYPLPFTDRIAEKPSPHKWRAVWIENEFMRAMVLPEIGGRVHLLQDKTNGYDLIYNQPVIKPALVGLAGPWASGGIEFNWPQHHRPATFLPVDFEIEEHPDGAKTIWCSDHDPMFRMKGMHGICLHPGRACLELKVRAYNRTPFTQTFLWWANIATRAHEAYQSFFPPDVRYVADHARRSMSEYPLAQGSYYGVNYGERARKGIRNAPTQFVPPHCIRTSRKTQAGARLAHHLPDYAPNDLSFYANIHVPTSYMCLDSQGDFVGGYDHKAEAGLVHVANHHIAPGKKQWTWGNHEFGYAWDRNLTEPDASGECAPYVEIMAGVYTDNQPDFSFLQPGETKTWSQYLYPIQKIGPTQQANLEAAIALRRRRAKPNVVIHLGVAVTGRYPRAQIIVERVSPATRNTGRGSPSAPPARLHRFTRDLGPDAPFVREFKLPRGVAETDLQICVRDKAGRELIGYRPKPQSNGDVPPPATEPPAPSDVASTDELYITGLHLDQYRHATRCPTIYWREALRRDPLDARCNNALGLWHLKRGEFGAAEACFRNAIQRLTRRNANPADGEVHYHLGLCLRHLGRDEDAYDAFYKSVWNQDMMAAGYHALAEIDCVRQNWSAALEHLTCSLRYNPDNLRARNLKVMVLRKVKRPGEATALLRDTLRLDRLDWWARHLRGDKLDCDTQTVLDITHDLARAGFHAEAIQILRPRVAPDAGPGHGAGSLPTPSWGTRPLAQYTLGWLLEKCGDARAARTAYKRAAKLAPDYCFPARLEEIAVLESAMESNALDPKAPYYLGNLLYDRRRHAEAILLWERSAQLDPNLSTVWRNLGIAYFNIRRQPAKARKAYDRAFQVNPSDARLLYERDQLWKTLRAKPVARLRELERHRELVRQRDDLSVELCALYNLTGQHEKALALVSARNFQPWEGGEGGPLGQWARSHLGLGQAALSAGDASRAIKHFEAALAPSRNLGEAWHLLANQSDIHYWLGCALAKLGQPKQARHHWLSAATCQGDFQEMSVRAFSEMTFYSGLSRARLGQKAKARNLFRELRDYARKLQATEARIDYFATSLPTMRLFDDDRQFRQETTALFLQAQAEFGLGRTDQAHARLASVLQREPSHAAAYTLQNQWHDIAR